MPATAPFTKTVRGVEIPTIGFGVVEIDPGETEDAVADALSAGYRHIDTASMYENEEEVGRGLKASGVDREDIWVTTKVWMEDLAPDDLRASAERSLSKLGLDHVELLLIPGRRRTGTSSRRRSRSSGSCARRARSASSG